MNRLEFKWEVCLRSAGFLQLPKISQESKSKHIKLVGGLEHVFFYILGKIIQIDIPFFQRGRYTTNQKIIEEKCETNNY